MVVWWVVDGVKCLYLVDLDGVCEGEFVNEKVIVEIVNNVDVFCELGGGICECFIIDCYFELGFS